MSNTNYPTIADIEQAKKDMTDINKFIALSSESFNDNTGKTRLTLEGLIAATMEATGYVVAGTFSAGCTVTAYNQIVSDGVNLWRWGGTLNKVVTAGSTPTPSGINSWNLVSDAVFKDSLAANGSTDLIAGFQAKQLRLIDGVKNLVPVAGVSMLVKGFYAGGDYIGHGHFYYKPDMSWVEHNGGTVIASGALAAWDGTAANLNTLLSFSTAGFGCFVRVDLSLIKIGMFGATNTTATDSGAIANHIINKLNPCDIKFPRGRWYFSTGIHLKRGFSVSGDSVFDDQTATTFVKAAAMNDPVIATDKYYGGIATHYYAIEGICIEGNRLTKTGGAVRKEAIAWWGVFVGSYINNVFVLNNYGSGISLEYSYDTKIGLLWINGCDVGTGAAFEIDQQLHNPSGPTGLIEIDSLYTENVYRESANGDPRTTASNRGHGIKAGMIYRLSINNLHQEAVDAGVELTHGTCYSINILNHSISWCGRPTGRMAAHYWNDVVPHVYNVGPVVVGDQYSGFAYFDCSTDVFNGGQVSKIPANVQRWGGMSFVSLAGQKADLYAVQVVGNMTRKSIGNQVTNYGKYQIESGVAARYHYDKVDGDYWSFGSTSNQASNAEVPFFRIESYGNAGDRVTFHKPFVIPTLPVTDFTDALYITSGGELRIRIGSGTFKVNLTAV